MSLLKEYDLLRTSGDSRTFRGGEGRDSKVSCYTDGRSHRVGGVETLRNGLNVLGQTNFSSGYPYKVGRQDRCRHTVLKNGKCLKVHSDHRLEDWWRCRSIGPYCLLSFCSELEVLRTVYLRSPRQMSGPVLSGSSLWSVTKGVS